MPSADFGYAKAETSGRPDAEKEVLRCVACVFTRIRFRPETGQGRSSLPNFQKTAEKWQKRINHPKGVVDFPEATGDSESAKNRDLRICGLSGTLSWGAFSFWVRFVPPCCSLLWYQDSDALAARKAFSASSGFSLIH